ncbi:hypothetical protein [Escherichia coli]|uniref:hypothetical protein n=1 Tax=Escherichia coli TaxID=562 RepID=UPI00165935D0|nr:hypothetical protein [Escherichia coli]MBC9377143.1 hypothetical protein [Escherichia coli]
MIKEIGTDKLSKFIFYRSSIVKQYSKGVRMDWYDIKWFFRDVCDSVSNVAGNIYDVAADGVGAVTDFIEENPKTSIAIGTVVGIATAGVAAPAIAASIGATGVLGTTAGGTAISSLSGAALSSASLAALGGGSIAAGGAGMAGGTCVVAAGGGIAAGTVSLGGVAATKTIKS